MARGSAAPRARESRGRRARESDRDAEGPHRLSPAAGPPWTSARLHGREDEDHRLAARVGRGLELDVPEERALPRHRGDASDGESVRVDAVGPRRDDEVVLLDGLDRRNVLDGDPALAVALRDAGARAAREEDARRGRLVGEELEARRARLRRRSRVRRGPPARRRRRPRGRRRTSRGRGGPCERVPRTRSR